MILLAKKSKQRRFQFLTVLLNGNITPVRTHEDTSNHNVIILPLCHSQLTKTRESQSTPTILAPKSSHEMTVLFLILLDISITKGHLPSFNKENNFVQHNGA